MSVMLYGVVSRPLPGGTEQIWQSSFLKVEFINLLLVTTDSWVRLCYVTSLATAFNQYDCVTQDREVQTDCQHTNSIT